MAKKKQMFIQGEKKGLTLTPIFEKFLKHIKFKWLSSRKSR